MSCLIYFTRIEFNQIIIKNDDNGIETRTKELARVLLTLICLIVSIGFHSPTTSAVNRFQHLLDKKKMNKGVINDLIRK